MAGLHTAMLPLTVALTIYPGFAELRLGAGVWAERGEADQDGDKGNDACLVNRHACPSKGRDHDRRLRGVNAVPRLRNSRASLLLAKRRRRASAPSSGDGALHW